MRLWVSLLRSKWNTSLSKHIGVGSDVGVVKSTRTEWGIGKGQWKRQARAAAKHLGMRGEVRAFYFVIGSRYWLEYEGTSAQAQLLYEAIR